MEVAYGCRIAIEGRALIPFSSSSIDDVFSQNSMHGIWRLTGFLDPCDSRKPGPGRDASDFLIRTVEFSRVYYAR
jgi:hypothetical protein